MRKKSNNTFGKRFIAVLLCVVVVSVSVNLEFASYIFANSTEIQGVFKETLSKDKTSSSIDLRIDETVDKTIESIILPNQKLIDKEDFKRDEDNQIRITYTIKENKKLNYVIEYTEKNVNMGTPEIKKETLTYEVKDVVERKELNLHIDAKDTTFKVGENIDFRKDITIKDENNKDITSQLNFHITSYGTYKKDKAGTYEISYEVKHPISKKGFSFTRKVVLADTKKEVSMPKETAANKGEIALSSSNATLTSPDKYDLSDEKQNTFNVAVHYAPVNADFNRRVVISIPEDFSFSKTPSINDFTGVTSVERKDNDLIISFQDTISTEINFEMTVIRNRNAIYKRVSKQSVDSEFKLVGYKDTTKEVLSDTFMLHLDKFDEPNYLITKNLNFGSEKVNQNKVSIRISVDRNKFSAYDTTLGLKIPKMISGFKYSSSSTNEDLRLDTSIYQIGNTYSYNRQFSNSNSEYYYLKVPSNTNNFDYAYDNRPLEFTLTYTLDRNIYSNGYFKSPNAIILTSDFGDKELGDIVIDTLINKPVIPDSSSMKNHTLTTNGIGDTTVLDVQQRIRFSSIPNLYLLKDLTYVYEFPYELKFKRINGQANQIRAMELYALTKKGKKITIDKYSGTLNEAVPEGDWVQKVVRFGMGEGWHTATQIDSVSNFDIEIRDIDEDGNKLANKPSVLFKETILSSDSNFKSISKETTLDLIVRDTDILEMMTEKENAKDSIVYTEQPEIVLSSMSFKKLNPVDPTVKVYKNLKINFENEKMLALATEVRFTPIATGSVPTVVYTTNKSTSAKKITRPVVNVWYGDRFFLDLSAGEYVTSLYVTFDNFDPLTTWQDSKGIDIVKLVCGKVPKYSLLNNEELNNIYYESKVSVTADNTSIVREVKATTPTFKWPTYASTFTVKDSSAINFDMNTTSNMHDNQRWMIARIDHTSSKQENNFIYKDLKLEITADKQLMSLISAISWDYSFRFNGTVSFETSLGRQIKKNVSSGGSAFLNIKDDLNKTEAEYITKVVIAIDEFSSRTTSGSFHLLADSTNVSPIDGSYLGDIGKNYPFKVKVSANDIEDEEKEGVSATISGRTEVDLYNMDSLISTNYTPQIYQGNQFDVSINPRFTAHLKGTYPYWGNRFYSYSLVNPIFYVEVDAQYSYVASSIKDIDGFSPKVTYLDKKTVSGNSVIKIDMTGYEKKVVGNANDPILIFRMMAKQNAVPAKNLSPIIALWTDLTDTKVDMQDGTKAKVNILNQVTDTTNVQDDKHNMLSYKKFYVSENEILPVNEMGIGNLAEVNGTVGSLVKGHDNDLYTQQLSLISNYQSPTKDWILYIPIPKKGKTVMYQENVNGVITTKESSPAAYSMDLIEQVNIPDLPIDATIAYTTDKNPVYVLDGTDVGNYTSSISDFELKDVTMIKIKIPTLGAKTKLYPVIQYKISSDKKDIGEQNAFGGVYFNTKVGTNTNYQYGNTGTYSKLVQYSILDFNVSGKVWEDRNEPSNHILDSNDIMKLGVKVIAIDKEGKEYEATTKVDGTYTISIPSYGKTVIKVELPNDVTSIPKKEYTFLNENKGTDRTSSVVNQATGTKEITFHSKDIYDINAGILPTRAIAVNPNDLVIVKGSTMPVPAVAFPKYAIISYQNAANTNIATVNARGLLTGVELGETTATVTIPDGKGGTGVISATYNIKVVPADVPSMTSNPITIFQNGTYDATKGIVILDGDKKPISATDTSKVTINTNSVDVSTPGRYPITYIINDGYNEVTATRYIYVHGNIQLVVPNDLLKKVGDSVTAIDGVSATYLHIHEDGTQTEKSVTVTTPKAIITSDKADKVKVSLEAKVTVDGAMNLATDSYTITFNEKAIIDAENDNVKVKVGATLEEIKEVVKASASMKTPDDNIDLTTTIDWSFLHNFDSSITGNTMTGMIYVLDPDTGEKVEKEITVTISKNIIIEALEELNLVVGDSFDPYANVTITDGDGKDISLTTDMIVSNTVLVDKDGKTTNRGIYKVEYQYTDTYGNTKRVKTTVNVHGVLQFEGLDRIDLIVKADTYVIDTAKAFYMNNHDKKVYVEGSYDNPTLDQRIVGKKELVFHAVHPIHNSKVSSSKQLVYIHGDIEFHKPSEIPIGKVNTILDPKTGVNATFDFVNDDGSITTKDVPVTSEVVTSKEVGYVKGKIHAEVEVVKGLMNAKDDTASVGFNGLPYLHAVNTIKYDGVISSKQDIITKMQARANVKLANGSVLNLTDRIDYNDVNRVKLDEKGNYQIKLLVTDPEGFTTYTIVNVLITIKTEMPNIPIYPIAPTNPQIPMRPNPPKVPEVPKVKDTAAAVSKDIPLSETKNGITKEFVKSYISAFTDKKGSVNFELISHNVLPKVGDYEATIRLDDGRILKVTIRVVDESSKDVAQPEYGKDENCLIHWYILLLFAGYSTYSIVAIWKRRNDNKKLEKALEGRKGYSAEGENKNEN